MSKPSEPKSIYPKDDLIRAWRALWGICNQKGRRFRSDIKIVVDQNQHDDYHEIGEMQLHDNHLKLGAEENYFGSIWHKKKLF